MIVSIDCLSGVDVSTLVTAGPPTSNGDLHLGHLSGPYTAGDIHTRYLRMTGRDVRYICAADDHQSYVALKAAQTGRAPAEVAAEYGLVIRDSLRRGDIALDYFGHPAQTPRYAEFLQGFVSTLRAKGALLTRTSDTPYCTPCDRMLFEAHIKGICNHCGAGSDGGICEACGRPNSGADLRDPRCAACGVSPASMRPATRLVFPLNHYRDYLRRYVCSAEMNTHARALCDALLASDLPDVAITQPAGWGILVPGDGFSDQRISAWFELGPHYLAVSDLLHQQIGGLDWRAQWTGNDVVQCFGFDSAYFHIILFPALFHAFDPDITPPKGFIINEFYRLDGRKFSTSRKHALWASEFLQRYPSDAVRFHLCINRPETTQTNFTLPEFLQTLNGELVGVWDGWLAGLAARTAGHPAPLARQWSPAHLRFYERLIRIISDVGASYEVAEFSTQRATRLLGELVREAQALAAANAHHADNAARAGEYHTGLALELAAARTLALLSYPIMPRFAAALWTDLDQPGSIAQAAWPSRPTLLAAETRLTLSAAGYFAQPHKGDDVLAA